MNENNNSQPTSSKENVRKKVEIDFNEAKWYSSLRSSKRVTQKIAEKANKSNSYKRSAETKNTVAKKRRISAESSTKLFKTRKYLSPSAKIDSKLPKVDDLLRARQESEKFKEIDRLIKNSSSQFLKELTQTNITIEEKPKIEDKKDCKHLTLKQLERKFRKDVDYLDGVFTGTIYSERHELFQKQLLLGNNTLKEDLRVSESFGAFTSEQLVHIVTLFRERFDDGNKYKYSDYYFKVLLPEYSFKLFKDCYKMSDEKALEYLKNVPLPDLFGLMP